MLKTELSLILDYFFLRLTTSPTSSLSFAGGLFATSSLSLAGGLSPMGCSPATSRSSTATTGFVHGRAGLFMIKLLCSLHISIDRSVVR